VWGKGNPRDKFIQRSNKSWVRGGKAEAVRKANGRGQIEYKYAWQFSFKEIGRKKKNKSEGELRKKVREQKGGGSCQDKAPKKKELLGLVFENNCWVGAKGKR